MRLQVYLYRWFLLVCGRRELDETKAECGDGEGRGSSVIATDISPILYLTLA